MVEEMSENLKVELLCDTLEVSRSGYYCWKDRPESERKKENQALMARIRAIHNRSRGTYGVPRIHVALKDEGHECGKNRVARIMREGEISGVVNKKRFVTTTDSNHDLPIAPRIFQVEKAPEQATAPRRVLASDITYVETQEGWLFLAVFLDIFSRRIVGLSMQEHMRTSLVLEALESAIGREKEKLEGMIIHSDRGSQFAAEAFREKMKQENFLPSMSRKGNCYDNSYVESFFHTLKTELIYRTTFATREEAKKAIFEYIEVWYNRERLHSSLGYKSPVNFEAEALAS
jgi:transposase InsO family protein